MLKKPNERKMSAEGEIRLFLRIFPLLAAHFELKKGLTRSGIFKDYLERLAIEYDTAAKKEKQSDKGFIESLPCVPNNASIKRDILDD